MTECSKRGYGRKWRGGKSQSDSRGGLEGEELQPDISGNPSNSLQRPLFLHIENPRSARENDGRRGDLRNGELKNKFNSKREGRRRAMNAGGEKSVQAPRIPCIPFA